MKKIFWNITRLLTGRKRLLLLLLLPVYTLSVCLAQDEEPDNRPIRAPFEAISLIDNQTTVTTFQGALKLEIAHRFSEIKELKDLFGIYGAANTRLALDYGITDRIMVGFGTERNNMLQELEWKVALLQQTRSGSMPVSISYFGNAVIDARSDDKFGPEENYKFIHRMSYLTQVIVSRKFGDKLAMQVIPTFAYFNGVPEGYNNINAGLSFGARAQVLGFHSIILEYDQPLTQQEAIEVKPNLAFGVEIGTSTHAFRLFVSSYSDLVKQHNMFYNTNDPFGGDLHFGFNISVTLR